VAPSPFQSRELAPWPLRSNSIQLGSLVAETEEHFVASLFIKKTSIGRLIRQAGGPTMIQRPGGAGMRLILEERAKRSAHPAILIVLAFWSASAAGRAGEQGLRTTYP
jgi:hypothetical protein